MINDEARAHLRSPSDLATAFLGGLQAAYLNPGDLGIFAGVWSLYDGEFQERWPSENVGAETLDLTVLFNRMVNDLVLRFPPIQRCRVSVYQEAASADLVVVWAHDMDLVDPTDMVTTAESTAAAVPMLMRWDGIGWLVHDIGVTTPRPPARRVNGQHM